PSDTPPPFLPSKGTEPRQETGGVFLCPSGSGRGDTTKKTPILADRGFLQKGRACLAEAAGDVILRALVGRIGKDGFRAALLHQRSQMEEGRALRYAGRLL